MYYITKMSANTVFTQRTTTNLTMTNSYQTVATGLPAGHYSLQVTAVNVGIVDLLLSGSDGYLIAGAGCDFIAGDFAGSNTQVTVQDGANYYMINLQFSNNELDAQLDASSSTPPGPVSFDLICLGGEESSVSSNVAIDNLYSSDSKSPITVNNDLQTTGRLRKTSNLTSNTALDNTYDVILCNPSGNITLTLPQVSSNNGREYSIINKSTNVITINTTAGDTINDGSTTSTTLSTQYSKIKLTSDNSSTWFSNI
jgi:hypothetical protein